MDRLFGLGVKSLTTRIHYYQKTKRSSTAYENEKIYRTVRESTANAKCTHGGQRTAHLVAKQDVGHKL
jgi:hypothetical protein